MLIIQTLKGRQEDREFKGHPLLESKFETSLGYIRPCYKINKKYSIKQRASKTAQQVLLPSLIM